jgi:hypothetical protein
MLFYCIEPSSCPILLFVYDITGVGVTSYVRALPLWPNLLPGPRRSFLCPFLYLTDLIHTLITAK